MHSQEVRAAQARRPVFAQQGMHGAPVPARAPSSTRPPTHLSGTAATPPPGPWPRAMPAAPMSSAVHRPQPSHGSSSRAPAICSAICLFWRARARVRRCPRRRQAVCARARQCVSPSHAPTRARASSCASTRAPRSAALRRTPLSLSLPPPACTHLRLPDFELHLSLALDHALGDGAQRVAHGWRAARDRSPRARVPHTRTHSHTHTYTHTRCTHTHTRRRAVGSHDAVR